MGIFGICSCDSLFVLSFFLAANAMVFQTDTFLYFFGCDAFIECFLIFVNRCSLQITLIVKILMPEILLSLRVLLLLLVSSSVHALRLGPSSNVRSLGFQCRHGRIQVGFNRREGVLLERGHL